MEHSKNLYINILLWAHDKGQDGFTQNEMMEQFGLSGDLWHWTSEIFFRGTDNDRPIIGRLKTIENRDYYSLTDKGMAAVLDYLELKEAREGSKKAIYIAIASLIVTAAIGIAQIWISVNAPNGSLKYHEKIQKYPRWFEYNGF